MKAIKFIGATACLALWGLSSCMTDNTTEAGSAQYAGITMDKETVDTLYTVDQYETLTINAPTVTQAPVQKEVKYIWEIDGKVVSNDATLNYPCNKYGTHIGRLTIVNGDNILYREFDVKVRFAYENGIYTFSEYQGKSYFSYLADRYEGKKVDFDVFRKVNAQMPIGTTPAALYFQEYNDFGVEAKVFYLATTNPSLMYRLQADTMNVTFNFGLNDQTVTSITHAGKPNRLTDTDVTVCFDNSIRTLTFNKPNFSRSNIFSQVDTCSAGDNVQFSLGTKGTSPEAIVLFDKKSNSILTGNSLKKIILFDQLQNYDYVGTQTAGTLTHLNMVSVVKNKETNKYKLFYFYPGILRSGKLFQKPDTIDNGREIPYTDPSSMAITTLRDKSLLLYSAGNRIYAYSLNSKGNFSNEPLITCPQSGHIVKMEVTPDANKLIVALNNASGDKVGSIYVYNISNLTTTPPLLWKAENCVGRITHLVYRP